MQIRENIATLRLDTSKHFSIDSLKAVLTSENLLFLPPMAFEGKTFQPYFLTLSKMLFCYLRSSSLLPPPHRACNLQPGLKFTFEKFKRSFHSITFKFTCTCIFEPVIITQSGEQFKHRIIIRVASKCP